METHDDPIGAALASRLGSDPAAALLDKMNSYSNFPNAVKGTARSATAPRSETAALALVEDPALAVALGLTSSAVGVGPSPTQQFWALLTLAARSDVGVLDRMADRLPEREYAVKLLATIRRAATKHAAAADSADSADDVAGGGGVPAASDAAALRAPQKVSEVTGWLAAHADADPAVLAPYEGQKTAARAAAVRTLGSIGTSRALEVLGQYADHRYPDAVLAELHRAWARFDRREFAARMFRPTAYTLDLGAAPTIEGIGAVTGLTSLDVVLTGGADLSPLAECTGLRTLRVGAEGSPGLLGVEHLRDLPELTELHLTRTTRNADLSPLADLGVRQLRLDLEDADGSFLLRMPRLESLRIAGSPTWDDDTTPGTATHRERQALVGVVLALVRQGVRVAVYRHQRSWVLGLLEQAERATDIVTVEANGYIGLADDVAVLEDMRRRLCANLLP